MAISKRLRVGTRGSALALAQTKSIVALIKKKFPKIRSEIIIIKTTGDKIKNVALSKIGGKGLFIKEIEESLQKKNVDFAVHSLKDLPTDLPEGLKIGAITKREDPHDCLISMSDYTLLSLPKGSVVGSSSLRRQAQILYIRRDLKITNLRGNLDTRLRKLKSGLYDAVVVAAAGLERLKAVSGKIGGTNGTGVRICKIPYSEMLPAVGQGSLAIEIREGDADTEKIISFLNDNESYQRAICERSFLKTLQGGCQVPVGALSEVHRGEMILEGLIASVSGEKIFRERITGPVQSAEEIGRQLAERLLQLGGEKVLDEIRH